MEKECENNECCKRKALQSKEKSSSLQYSLVSATLLILRSPCIAILLNTTKEEKAQILVYINKVWYFAKSKTYI